MACSITCKNNFLDIFTLVDFPKILWRAKEKTTFRRFEKIKVRCAKNPFVAQNLTKGA